MADRRVKSSAGVFEELASEHRSPVRGAEASRRFRSILPFRSTALGQPVALVHGGIPFARTVYDDRIDQHIRQLFRLQVHASTPKGEQDAREPAASTYHLPCRTSRHEPAPSR